MVTRVAFSKTVCRQSDGCMVFNLCLFLRGKNFKNDNVKSDADFILVMVIFRCLVTIIVDYYYISFVSLKYYSTQTPMENSNKDIDDRKRGLKNKLNMRKLRISLKYRPEIYNLIVKMQHNIKKKMRIIREMQQNIKKMVKGYLTYYLCYYE